MENNEQIDIVVCMGSSCFVRGNKKNLEYIEGLIEKDDLNIKLELSGNRCEKKCDRGPNIIINNKIHNNITKSELEKIFSGFLNKKRADIVYE